MTPFEEAMAAPRIENGQDMFTCFALGAAVRSAFPGLTLDELVGVRRRYCRQYALSCESNGARPWWDSGTAGPGPRLRALRQLCLDAAK